LFLIKVSIAQTKYVTWCSPTLSKRDVIQNLIGIVVGNLEVFVTRVHGLAPQLTDMHWHAASTKLSVFNCRGQRSTKQMCF